ncbi:unnamed protein product [Rotaria socialis]|uniref:U6 snRNA-associated Sm-like protein LSm4 n=1 Tax=Rotaria socialis TaxID=392032 RepID=A0A820TLK3_9BILA|nr:unnamed protein product [Rotaria socialis]CAF3442312.1 unnamed protein product [Rotaria socialis]CAF3522948.1 unnamed protein product [Rotaria socialis]CAF3697072.1 unnamed protein product [Rotaria socialis]CAF4092008.1 unnamed protein product [Rotaria socialis]
MLPLTLLRTAVYHPMLVELKNGETYNGNLMSCDNFMNIHLRDVICTSRDGDRFWKIPECYIRGNTIKYLRLPEDILGLVKEDVNEKPSRSGQSSRRPFRGRGDGGRGGYGGRSGGGGDNRNNYKGSGGGGGGGGGGGRGGHQGSRGGGRGGGQFRQGRQ